MKRAFAVKLSLFLLPLFGLLAIRIEGTLQYGLEVGELIPVQYVVEQQYQNSGDTIVYRSEGSREDIYDYKLRTILKRQPSILLLGSSRMGRFREQSLDMDSNNFYNGFVAWQTPQEQVQFLEQLEKYDALPKVLILELNLPNFNADFEAPIDKIILNEPSLSRDFTRLSESFIRIERTPYLPSIKNLDNRVYWGLGAQDNLSGYLRDGSIYFSNTPINWLDDHYLALNTETSMYTAGQDLNEANLQYLTEILTLAKKHKIQVIGILPPYRQEFYNRMMESGDYTYIEKSIARLESLFSQYNFSLMNVSSAKTVGGADDELFDSWHPGELLSLRIYLMMLSHNSDVLGTYSDIERLQSIIDNAVDPFHLFF